MARTAGSASTPAEIVDIDLDHYEHEKGAEPFKAKVRGRTLTFNDPLDQPWHRLVNLGDDFYGFLGLALNGTSTDAESDLGYFLALQDDEEKALSTRDIRVLMEAYARHFGLDSQGNGGVSRT